MLLTLYYLSDFSNYYNRQLKLAGKTRVEDFEQWVVKATPPTNFNPNDGVDTVIDVNYTSLPDDVEVDYMVTSEDNVNVKSRWFVIERTRNLAGQWHIVLHRDLLADYYSSWTRCPAFVEKAMLPITSNLIFNKENGINYNQIKYREDVLTDETGCGWIVGYVASSDIGTKTITIHQEDTNLPAPPISLDTLMSYQESEGAFVLTDYSLGYIGTPYFDNPKYPDNAEVWNFLIRADSQSGDTSSSWKTQLDVNNNDMITFKANQSIADARRKLASAAYSNRDLIASEFSRFSETALNASNIDSSTFNMLMNMNGNIYKSESNVFKVNCTASSASYGVNLNNRYGGIYTSSIKVLDDSQCFSDYSHSPIDTGISAYINYDLIRVKIDTHSIPESTVTITNNARVLDDSPYRMFCIPFGSAQIFMGDGFVWTKKEMAKELATKISTELGSNVYDVQYLPYFPIRDLIRETNAYRYIDLEEATEGVDYNLVKDQGGNVLQLIFWSRESNFSAFIYYPISVQKTALEFKVDNETQFMRLCSPNYSGTFEFKPTMNGGVTGFEVNCTYKPYQPYIHVNPLFSKNGLYGGDFNDQRGLVCTGDFSMPIVNNAWTQYQINNKSYADSFNRQIENMDTTYDITRSQQITAGIIGAMSSGVSGSVAGAKAGGPAGMAVGAAASGLASLAGLAQDLYYGEKMHKEATSFAKDNYGYQLQNIKALPYSLGKVSAFTINNKVFPFIEWYTATNEEREALRKKIKYDGMTTMVATDYIGEYLTEGGYIQAQLIRYIAQSDKDVLDNHGVLALAQEIHRGVYL